MRKYNKNNITLQIRVPVGMAISLLGRLYGCGLLSKEDYMAKLEKISQEEATKEMHKSNRLTRLIEKAEEKGRFFGKK